MTMMVIQYMKMLIVARYLSLMAHMIIVLALFISRVPNVKAGLPKVYAQAEYDRVDWDFSVDLALSMTLLILEFTFFCTGMSMFRVLTSLYSTFIHCFATILMSHMILIQAPSKYFWWLFAFGNAVPAGMDMIYIGFDYLCMDRAKYNRRRNYGRSYHMASIYHLFDV